MDTKKVVVVLLIIAIVFSVLSIYMTFNSFSNDGFKAAGGLYEQDFGGDNFGGIRLVVDHGGSP